jgi:predicted component of type VI protein secretion system
MAKTLYGYRIGANVHEKDAPQGVKLVPDNKTLIALPFNDEHDDEVDPVRLKSLKEIFAHYEPNREVVFKTAEDDTEELVLKFNSLKDFTKDGIVEQSKTLQSLQEQEIIYSRMADILQNNEKLLTVLSNEEYKKEFLELLETLIEELKETE